MKPTPSTIPMKKPLPGNDAAILALLAYAPSLPYKQILIVIDDLSCDEAKQIGRDIVNSNFDNAEAKAFLDWAKSLKAKTK